MGQLFKRACVVQLDPPGAGEALRIEGLRVQFQIEKDTKPEPNSAKVTIWNLSEQTRGVNAQKKGTRLRVLAGYEGDISQVFDGEISNADHRRDGPDWVSRFTCADGGLAYRYARVNKSFAPGTRVSDVVRQVVQAFNLDKRQAEDAARGVPGRCEQGLSLFGPASTALEKVLRPRGYEWSMQDGRLQVLKKGEPATTAVLLISEDTGLVGSPELGTAEVKGGTPVLKVRTLLMPSIRAGGLVAVRSLQHRGTFRVEKLSHSGDTSGGEWYSDLEVKPR